MSTDREKKLEETLNTMNRIVHNMIVANQAAWIEWKHGRGCESAMTWIENGLDGPGQIPDPDGKSAQEYFDSNIINYTDSTSTGVH